MLSNSSTVQLRVILATKMLAAYGTSACSTHSVLLILWSSNTTGTPGCSIQIISIRTSTQQNAWVVHYSWWLFSVIQLLRDWVEGAYPVATGPSQRQTRTDDKALNLASLFAADLSYVGLSAVQVGFVLSNTLSVFCSKCLFQVSTLILLTFSLV